MPNSTKKNIIIAERFALEALFHLKKNSSFNVLSYSDEALNEAHALVIRSKFKIDSQLLEKTKKLQLIVTCTSGFDHIDLDETKKRGITVMYTPDANAVSAAELAWTLIMAANRKVTQAHRQLIAGHWDREAFLSNELAGKTLGIVGLGRIGSKVAKFAQAFNMNIIAFDPYQTDQQFSACSARRVSYEEVLKESDILTFHVPQTFETKNMFTRSQLEYVSEETILVNTSRGQVINEDDLAAALQSGRLKFAALDVFNKEPLGRDSKLLKCKNAIFTPHLGAYTEEAFLKASLEACDRIIQFFLENKSINTLPLQNDWGSLSFAERN